MTPDPLALHDFVAAMEARWLAPVVALALLLALILTLLAPPPRGSRTASFALTAVTLLSG